MEKIELSAGEKKIQEYIERIQNGENKEDILNGLPSSFAESIERGLQSHNSSELPEEVVFEKDLIVDENNEEEIESIRGDILYSFENGTQSNFEKYDITLPNIDEVIKSGGGQLSVIANGANVDFDKLILVIDDNTAEVAFIEKKDKSQNKGIGIDLYIEIGKKLAESGIEFNSSLGQYGPGRDLWLKLAKLGFAEKKGGVFVFRNSEHDTEKTKVSSFEMFKGAVIETIKHNYNDSIFAYDELNSIYNNGKNTVSDKTVNILATLGATVNYDDLMKLTRGDRDYVKKLLYDFDKAFMVINNEN